MAKLSRLIASEIARRDLTAAAAARAIGVSPLSLTKVLAGTSKPNARTLSRYEAFLGQVGVAQDSQVMETPPRAGRARIRRAQAAKAAPGPLVTRTAWLKAGKLIARVLRLTARARDLARAES